MPPDPTPEAPLATSTPTPTARDALIAAAEAAASKDPPAPKLPATDTPPVPVKDGEPAKTGEDAPATPEETPLTRIGAALKSREKAQQARDEAAQMRTELEQMRQQIAQEKAEATKMRAEAEAERARIHKLKTNPMEAIKDLGWDRQRLVDEVVREGQPEWQHAKRLEAELEQLRTKTTKYDEWFEQQTKRDAEQQQQRQHHERAQTEQQFLTLVSAESALRSLYEDSEIVAKGHEVADRYYKATKQVAPLEEIRDYLEEQAKTRIAKLTGRTESAESGPPKKANGTATRTLSAQGASERRATPKPTADMTPEELRKELELVAEESYRSAT